MRQADPGGGAVIEDAVMEYLLEFSAQYTLEELAEHMSDEYGEDPEYVANVIAELIAEGSISRCRREDRLVLVRAA